MIEVNPFDLIKLLALALFIYLLTRLAIDLLKRIGRMFISAYNAVASRGQNQNPEQNQYVQHAADGGNQPDGQDDDVPQPRVQNQLWPPANIFGGGRDDN